MEGNNYDFSVIDIMYSLKCILNSTNKKISELSDVIDNNQLSINEITNKYKYKTKEFNNMKVEFNNMKVEYDKILKEIESLKLLNQELKQQVESEIKNRDSLCEKNKNEIRHVKQQKDVEIANIKSALDIEVYQHLLVKKEYNQLKESVEQLQRNIELLTKENRNIKNTMIEQIDLEIQKASDIVSNKISNLNNHLHEQSNRSRFRRLFSNLDKEYTTKSEPNFNTAITQID